MTDITADGAFDGVAPKTKTKTNSKWRKILLGGLAAKVALTGVAYAGYWALVSSNYVTTDNAYVGASVAQINSQVSGPVLKVAVEDTQAVRKGDVLVTIDPTDAR